MRVLAAQILAAVTATSLFAADASAQQQAVPSLTETPPVNADSTSPGRFAVFTPTTDPIRHRID